jgi:hypothetical protein
VIGCLCTAQEIVRANKLTPSEIDAALAELNQGLDAPWRLVDEKLEKEFRFPNFVAAFAFMTRAASPTWISAWRAALSRFRAPISGLTFLHHPRFPDPPFPARACNPHASPA